MKHEIHIVVIEEIVNEIREIGLRYQAEADQIANGDYTDDEKADSKAALRGFTLAYLHLTEVAMNAIKNYDALVAIGDTYLDSDDSAFPGNYL
jgi:hypothetical protein